MSAATNSVTDKNLRDFFVNMFLSDPVPHTPTRISPISFREYLARTNVITLQQKSLYKQACAFWRETFETGPFRNVVMANGLSICEEQQCSWNPLIDHLKRLTRAMEFEFDHQRMHYVAHVCYLMGEVEDDKDDNIVYYKSLFANIVSSLCYTNTLNCSLEFLPIMSSFDPRFTECCTFMCATADKFVQSHLGTTIGSYTKYDIDRLNALKTNVTAALKCIQQNKDRNQEAWTSELSKCLLASALLNADMHACELYRVMERDGLACCKPLRELKRMLKAHEKGQFINDPDEATDCLLDVYSSITRGLHSYNIPTGPELKSCET